MDMGSMTTATTAAMAMATPTGESQMDMDMGMGGSSCKISVCQTPYRGRVALAVADHELFQMLWNWNTIDACKFPPCTVIPSGFRLFECNNAGELN